MNAHFARTLVCGCLIALPAGLGSVLAHEGHKHAPAPAAAVTGLAPRAAAASPDLELVAEWRNDGLLIYLDRFATNAPLSGATIDVEEGSNRVTAVPAGEGLYQAEAPWLARPGRHSLVFTVQTQDLADLLTATLEVPEKGASAEKVIQNGFSTRRIAYAAAGAALLLLAGALFYGRRRQHNQTRVT